MRLFSDVQIFVEKTLGDQVWLTIQVTELPKVSKYAFTGTTKSEDEDLRPQLDIIKNVTPFADYTKTHIYNTVREYYAEKGFLNAEIDVYGKPDTSFRNSVIVYIDVVKNAKVKIATIDIHGNTEMSDRDVLKNMKETRVRTQIKRDNGAPVSVNYSLHATPRGWLAWDVVIEGVSYVKNYRTDFGTEIDQKGLDAVIQRLETQNASGKPDGAVTGGTRAP